MAGRPQETDLLAKPVTVETLEDIFKKTMVEQEREALEKLFVLLEFFLVSLG
jgi:hypothetical protein